MTPEQYVFWGGVIVAAITVLGGGLFALLRVLLPKPATLVKPEPLSRVAEIQAKEIERLNARIVAMQIQIDDLTERLSTVIRFEHEKSQLMAGVALLTHQIVAGGGSPIWSLPENIAPRSGSLSE